MMKAPKPKYVFGPVPSRRLGRSLGVDLVPIKTCSFDCVYCQVGRSEKKTIDRQQYVPTDEVIEQVRRRLDEDDPPDVITFSGSGEPTLHRHLGQIIRAIKTMASIPVAVLTNGSLLYQPEVRAQLLAADVVVPNLDAGSPAIFERVCRPHPALEFEQTVKGLIAFAREFKGELALEVFLLENLNANPEEVAKIAAIVDDVKGARVQLNSVARPAPEDHVRRVPPALMSELAGIFTAPVEVVVAYREREGADRPATAGKQEVLAILHRRPATIFDVAQGLGVEPRQTIKFIEALLADNLITASRQGDKTYYCAK